jgi:hypothetical protein
MFPENTYVSRGISTSNFKQLKLIALMSSNDATLDTYHNETYQS